MIPATDSGSFLDLVGNFATDPVHRLVHRVVEMLLLRQSFSLPNRGLRGGGTSRPISAVGHVSRSRRTASTTES